MICNIFENLTLAHLNQINGRLKRPEDYKPWVEKKFPQMASEIINLVEKIRSEGRNEILPEDLNRDIPTKVAPTQQIKDYTQPDDIVEINYNGDKNGIDRMYTKFSDAIIAISIFDKKTGKPAMPNRASRDFENALNQKMFEFKESLIKAISDFTGFEYTPGFVSEIATDIAIQSALASFYAKQSSGNLVFTNEEEQQKYYDALDAYTILKNFDKLLRQVTPFVKIKDGYENVEAKNRYEFVGGKTNVWTSWTTEEAVDISDQISDVIKTLLDYFVEYTNNGPTTTPISQTGFYQVMTAFKKWLRETPFDDESLGEEITGESKTNRRRRIASEILRLYKGDNEMLSKYFNLFYNHYNKSTVASSFHKDKMRGLKKMFDFNIDLTIKDMFWNLAFKEEKNIVETTSVHNGAISNKRLEDNYKRRQWFRIRSSIASRLYSFRNTEKEAFTDFCKKYGIVLENGEVVLFRKNRDERGNPIANPLLDGIPEVTITSKDGSSFSTETKLYGEIVSSADSIPNDFAKTFIEDLLDTPVPDNYGAIIEQMSGGGTTLGLMSLYGNAIGVILHGAFDTKDVDFENRYDEERESVSLRKYNLAFKALQEFLGKSYSADITPVNKNEFGNNVAAYTLTSMIHRMGMLVLEMETKDNHSYKSNPVFKQIRSKNIGDIIARGDVNIMGKMKQARNLTVSEVAYLGIVCDFWNSFNKKYGEGEENYITFQNTTNSDKNTHHKIPYSRNFKIDDENALGPIIESIISGEGREDAILKFRDAIFNSRKGSYQTILYNLVSDLVEAFGEINMDGTWFVDPMFENNSDFAALIEFLNNISKDLPIDEALENAINDSTQASLLIELVKNALNHKDDIRDSFRIKGVTYVDELHNKINDTLFNCFETYIVDNGSKFDYRIKEQQRYFLQDLIESGFSLNIYADYGNLKPLVNKIGKSWMNELTGDVLLYKGDLNGEFELNPMLEAYYFSDTLLSNSFNEILFGRTWFHPDKHKPGPGEIVNGKKTDLYYARAEASRLAASYKRTVIAGATEHSFKPRKYGISDRAKYAIVKDLPATVWNMLGIEKADLDACDGSGLSSPHQAQMENWSLLDASVGWDKKTIIGDVDPKYGMPKLIKWAVYAITNERRRLSWGSKISLEHVYKKMHNAKIDPEKVKKIKLQDYYIASNSVDKFIKYDSEQKSFKLTETSNIYREDPDTGMHWWITNLRSENGVATWVEIPVDINGKRVVGLKPIPRSKAIESIYDIDQIFGGAWAMQKNKQTNELEFSDVSTTVVTKIICNEELKDYMTGYVINKSAVKDGVTNLNPTESLTNDDDFWTDFISMLYAGLQMNADHLLKDSDVTLMTQMISALIQTGYFTDEVRDIYNEIGKVVAESLNIEKDLADRNDFEKIHLMLGKALIEDFSSGSKDTIGLAQSYLMKAAKMLAEGKVDVKIPFSDPTLKGAFIANLVSNLNKKGIRERYAGIADVLVPARGMITSFKVGNFRGTYPEFAKWCRKQGLKRSPLTYVKNRGKLVEKVDELGNSQFVFELFPGEAHPFIQEVTSLRDIDDGDYLISVTTDENGNPIVDENGNYIIEEIEMDSWWKFYNTKQKPQNRKLFRWTCKPTDLRQQNTFFEVNGERYSVYELDSVASTHFLAKIWNGESDFNPSRLSEEEYNMWLFIEQVLKEPIPKSGNISKAEMKLIRMKLERAVKADFRVLDKKLAISTNEAFRTIENTEARTWLYRPKHEASLEINPSKTLSNVDIFLKLVDIAKTGRFGEHDMSKIREFKDIPNVVKIALAYRPEDVNKIIVDAVDFGIDFNELVELIGMYYGLDDSMRVHMQNAYNILISLPKGTRNSMNPVSNVNVRFAEIMMGRINAEKLGLRKGDSIAEVKELKEKFFRDRIIATAKKPSELVMDRTKYDIVLTGSNGEKLFVALKSNHSDDEFLHGMRPTPEFEDRNGTIFKNGVEVCSKIGKKFYSIPSVEGESFVVLVDDLSEIEEMLESDVYDIARYNYTTSNQRSLFEYQFRNKIENGVLTEDILLFNEGNVVRKLEKNKTVDSVFGIENVDALRAHLDVNEYTTFMRHVDNIARQKYAAFEKQLYCVGARIPTQSMQSFMVMEIVGFTDSDVNEVYVPAAQTWLQGSDYDIDKLYIMLFEISKKGTLPTFSSLRGRARSLDPILNLKYPTGITYNEGEGGVTLTNDEVIRAISLEDVSAFNKVLSGDSDLVAFDGVRDSIKEEFLRMLNQHSNSKTKGNQKKAALKNAVVHKIIELLKHPRLHVPSHNPINMDVLQDLAKQSKLSRREQTLTSDSPLVKFIMQVQNMVGKDVIGITAVGLKVYFATSTFVNQRVQDVVRALEIGDAEAAKEYLYDITFIDKYTGNVSTLANTNLEPLYEYIQIHGNVDFDFDVHGITNLKDLLLEIGMKASLKDTYSAKKFLKNCGLSEEQIHEMELEAALANIDAADSISQLLSAATDNAKELILSKINATPDFADAWVYLMTSGWSITEIGNLLMSPIFGVVSDYTKTDLFSDLITSSNPEKAVKFVLGLSQLSGIDIRNLKIVVGSYPDRANPEIDNNCFANKLKYEIYEEDAVIDGVTYYRGELKLVNGRPIKRARPLITDAELEQLFDQGSDFRKNSLSLLGRTDSTQDIIDSTWRCEILLHHLEYLLKTKLKSNNGLDDSEMSFEELLENLIEDDNFETQDEFADHMDESDLFGDMFEDDNYEKRVNEEDFGRDDRLELSIKQTRDLYRYTIRYLLPKQQKVVSVVLDENGEGYDEFLKLKKYYEEIYPGVKEQQICGASLGVNQGLATDQHTFYSKLKKLQNFINEALPNEEVPFDIYSFLVDEPYRDIWIAKYDTVKIKTNPLKLIWGVDHFREMFKLNAMAHKFMNHSFAAKLNFKLEQVLLKGQNQVLSEEEWKAMDKYTRDLILFNWLFSKNITFGLPSTEKNGVKTNFMRWGKDDYGQETLESSNDGEKITLSDGESAATFVRLFELHIVPYLKSKYKNAFTRNIETDHRSSKTHNRILSHKKLSMNTMMIDSSSKTKAEYAEILKSFNEIADEVIPEVGLTVKDALFIYNTLIYKNAFTESGFTRLMETINLKDDDSLINDYSAYIGSLDYGDYDLGSIDNPDEIVNEDGSFNLGVIKGHINDLKYRLAFTSNAKNKFGITIEKDSNGAIDQLRFTDMFDHDLAAPLEVSNPNANDWTLDMPAFDKVTAKKKVSGYGEGKQRKFTINSREVVFAIKDSLIEKFGLQDKVVEIKTEDITKAWEDPENSDLSINSVTEYYRMSKAKAFLHNGIIYVNTNNVTNDTMLHEIMHMMFIAAKFNSDEKVRKTYYSLLNSAMQLIKTPQYRETYIELAKRYSEEKGSDFKEEVLVHLLTEAFVKEMQIKFGGVRYDSDIKPFVINIINEVCETKVPENVDTVKLGHTTLGNLVTEFRSGLLNLDNNALSAVNISLSQKLKTLKRILIQAGQNGKNSYIKYNC